MTNAGSHTADQDLPDPDFKTALSSSDFMVGDLTDDAFANLYECSWLQRPDSMWLNDSI